MIEETPGYREMMLMTRDDFLNACWTCRYDFVTVDFDAL